MIHTTAIVHPGAELGEDVEVGPYCLVGEHVKIGARTRLLAHIVVNGHTTIGTDVTIHPFATVGTPSQDRKSVKGEITYTIIGDRTVIRDYTSIQRGTGDGLATVVGADCLLQAYVHVAHNCRIGNFVTMANLTQLAGHVTVEDYATIGGLTGVHQFVRIGKYAMIGGMSRLGQDAPPFFVTEGSPPTVRVINREGLRRWAIPQADRAELKRCHAALMHPGVNLRQALEALRGTVTTDSGLALLQFLEAPSDRGVTRIGKSLKSSAGEE